MPYVEKVIYQKDVVKVLDNNLSEIALVLLAIALALLIIALVLMKNWLLRHERAVEAKPRGEAFIASFRVCSPAIFNKSLATIAGFDESKFVITRIWRGENAILPTSETVVMEGDLVLLITENKFVNQLTVFFGKLFVFF